MLNLIKHAESSPIHPSGHIFVCICRVCWTEIAELSNPHRNTVLRKSVENVDQCHSSFLKEVLNIFSYLSWVISVPASRVLIANDGVLLLWAMWSLKLIREIFTPSAPRSILITSRAMHLLYVHVRGYSAWKTNGYWFLQCNLHFFQQIPIFIMYKDNCACLEVRTTIFRMQKLRSEPEIRKKRVEGEGGGKGLSDLRVH